MLELFRRFAERIIIFESLNACSIKMWQPPIVAEITSQAWFAGDFEL
jgi:hypothetical protein